MNRPGDAGSCAALAAQLATQARRLRDAADAEGATPAVEDLVDLMDTTAAALNTFAAALRSPAPTRRGLAHPHTALATTCRRLLHDHAEDGSGAAGA